MVVLVLTACPAGLRGHLTRWLLEISPGVFVGFVSTRVRDLLWERVTELAKDGRAIMVHSQRGEQRLAFRVHRHDWEPVDIDGVHLIRRPGPKSTPGAQTNDIEEKVNHSESTVPSELRPGWSNASKYRRYGKNKRGNEK